jgi:hypothetical protein
MVTTTGMGGAYPYRTPVLDLTDVVSPFFSENTKTKNQEEDRRDNVSGYRGTLPYCLVVPTRGSERKIRRKCMKM